MVNTYYQWCCHWGFPLVETPCARGGILKSGCSENAIVGSTRIDGLCSACEYRASVVVSHIENSHQSQRVSQTSKPPFAPSLDKNEQSEQTKSIAHKPIERHLQITHPTANDTQRSQQEDLHLCKQATIKEKNAIVLLPITRVIFSANERRCARVIT